MSSEPAEPQLTWEAKAGRPAGAAALASAILAAASTAVQVGMIGAPPDSEREALTRFNEHEGEFFLSLGLQAASYFLLTGALLYLLRATMYRRPETPRFTSVLLLLAPLLLAVGGVLNQLDLNDVASEFLSGGERSESRAEDLLEDRNVVGGAIGSGGTLCLALSFVLIGLNAMRAGLLSRFMGYLGVVVGVLLVLPLLPGGQSTVQLFWVAALGLLFLGRWPGGRGPAWETGEATPWPSAADARAQPGGPEGGATEPESPQPVERKRSRKKRRR
ncbi:MAG: DUF4386 family protein [Actinomycetota bacterium]|nr:DUF4386 family protein [Actinomycetota bacterium]